ncbi:hypothetical protein QQY66_05210 [Streptomyces sp. DG2A-72]|uniref:hypothetical protein n=1 Tax=Streptomyces sp. DG2A-72 TaxID=3051386 RepID=UPI00265BAE57|nr:hypothetical protein [Streptomyces sp. DG2A-72]MDO0931108.1 hypothetical protein [Streptomyces sp. DG2A-72]
MTGRPVPTDGRGGRTIANGSSRGAPAGRVGGGGRRRHRLAARKDRAHDIRQYLVDARVAAEIGRAARP